MEVDAVAHAFVWTGLPQEVTVRPHIPSSSQILKLNELATKSEKWNMKPRLACVYVWHWPSETPVAVLTWTCWSGEVCLKNDEVYFLSPCPSLCVSLPVCVSVFLCVLYLSPHLSLRLYVSVYLCVLSLCLYVFICFSLSVYSLCVFVFLCFSLSVYFLSVYSLSVCLYVSVCFNLYTNSVSLSLSLSLSPFLSFSLSPLCPSVCIYIYRVELCDCLFCSPRTSCTVALTTPLMCGRHQAASSRLARLTMSAAQSTRWPSPSCLSSQVIQVGTTGFGFLWTVHYYR